MKTTNTKASKNIYTFRKQCINAISNLFGLKIKTDEDFWSLEKDGISYYETLKRDNCLFYNDEFIAVSFQFDAEVYTDTNGN